MGASIDRTLTLMLGGTSLTAGRLCNPPLPWTRYLLEDMRASVNCKGPVRIINTGKGSQTSNFGATQAALFAPLRPTHVLMEDFGINDCAIGPVSIPTATANFNSMVASYLAANPDVVIVHQTMSPASAGDANRTNLATYYSNGLTNAALNGLESLDNYNGTVLVPGGWPKPLDPAVTVGAVPFAYALPTGYSGWGSTAWNPADKSADITLSNEDLTMTGGGAGDDGARAVSGLSTGKVYFEVTIVVMNAPPNASVVGIETSGASLNNYVGAGANGWGYSGAGFFHNNGANLGTPATFTSGDVISVAVDFSTTTIWWAKNGTWQNGNPNTPTGGQVFAAGTWFPASSLTPGASSTGHFYNQGDGLHPLWSPNAFQAYSYPNILAWANRAMADFW